MTENERSIEWAAEYISGYETSFRARWHKLISHLPYWLQLGLWDLWEPRR